MDAHTYTPYVFTYKLHVRNTTFHPPRPTNWCALAINRKLFSWLNFSTTSPPNWYPAPRGLSPHPSISSGSDHIKSHIAPSCGTSCLRSITRIWVVVSGRMMIVVGYADIKRRAKNGWWVVGSEKMKGRKERGGLHALYFGLCVTWSMVLMEGDRPPWTQKMLSLMIADKLK